MFANKSTCFWKLDCHVVCAENCALDLIDHNAAGAHTYVKEVYGLLSTTVDSSYFGGHLHKDLVHGESIASCEA